MSVPALILSDLHLGAPHSALNLKHWHPSEIDGIKHGEAAREVLVQTMKGLAGGDEVERLILLGDVIDLSHGTMADGLRELITLLRRIRDAIPIQQVVLVPGNHDRHWWDMQCQFESLIKPLLDDNEAASKTYYPRTTDTAGRRGNIPVITNPLHEHQDLPITLAYPDYEFAVSGKRVRCQHGHLLEDLYLIMADLLASVLEDLSEIRRRDPDQAPTPKQRKRFEAARDAFRESLLFTLESGVGAQAHLELVERLSAPFVNLDWLFLGQTGLLRREGDREAIGRALNAALSAAVKADRDKLVGLGEFVGLSAMDIIAKRDDGKLHSYSNNPIKTSLITPTVEKFVDSAIEENEELPLPPVDAPSSSLSRGKTLEKMKPAIRRYLERFAIPWPDVLVVGHTHVKGAGSLKKGSHTMRLVNTGSWTSSLHRKVPDSRVCRIGPQAGVGWADADLKE
ncbi:MAG: metallophosphoesterase [Gemmatimonadota bacterium]|nr:MAG: metallophosphoesterase [Gemmatimonadota bacterium]